MHFNGQEAGSLLSPGQNLLDSRPESHPTSPWLGRTPGPAVVQEGRLSLEMLSQQFHNEDSGKNGALASALEPPRESIGLPSLPAVSTVAHNKQPLNLPSTKLTPPTLLAGIADQLNMKEALTTSLLHALPEKLTAQMQQTLNAAKASLGLHSFDASVVEQHLFHVLRDEGEPRAEPRRFEAEPEQLPSRATDAAVHPISQQRVGGRRTKRQRSTDDLENDDTADPATLAPAKRVQWMNRLYHNLRQTQQLHSTLNQAINQARGKLADIALENEQLWAAMAHIGAAMHAAIEERDKPALPHSPSLQPAVQIEPLDVQYHPPYAPTLGGAPMPTISPGVVLGSIFSPNGDDLFAACNMFVSPAERMAAAAEGEKLRWNLFPDGQTRQGVHAPEPVTKAPGDGLLVQRKSAL